MKRLCIYLTYDKSKIVDKYIGYMLKELKTCVDYLVVVCNEEELVRGAENLEEYADEIFYRRNIGFDAGGFKDALCDYIGWDKVLQYNELVLVNDSMFGPFKPMKSIFEEMEGRSADFWGLIKHGVKKNSSIGYIPEHIQTYFLVIRSRMMHSQVFRAYWENMPYYATFNMLVKEHETSFTHYFSNLGYSYDVLADTKANEAISGEDNYSHYAALSYELIRKRNFPFLKKQQIAYNLISIQTQENLSQAIDYIDHETDYDVNLIWENIIRTLNVADLQRSLHLQYIIPQEGKRIINRLKVTILVYIAYKESAEYILEYLGGLDHDYDIKIVAENEELLEEYRKQGFECLKDKTEWKWEKWGDLCNNDFVCVVHDVDVTTNVKPSCTGKSYLYNVWENMIKDKNHLSGILETFCKEPHLGFLAPPQPNFAEYFGDYGRGWDGKWEKIQEISQRVGFNCPVSESKPPYRVTNNFWIRGCILKQLADLEDDVYEYLPFLWSYFAQQMGYYSGIVESMDYVSMNEVNMQYYLDQIACQVRSNCNTFLDFADMRKYISQGAVQEFCRKHTHIFVYGAGNLARIYKDILVNVEAYVTTDGYAKPKELYGIPVKYISEIEVGSDCGFVLCLSETAQAEVIPLLKRYGIENYICV